MFTADELPAAEHPSPGGTLVAGRLKVRQAVLYGIAAMGVPATLASQGAYVAGGGYTAWLAIAVASAIAGLLSTIVVRFARQYLVSGSLMSYLRLSLGERAGLLGGAALSVGYAGAITSYLSVTLYFGFAAMQEAGLPPVSLPLQILTAAAALAGCCFLQQRGVGVSVNAAIVASLLVAPFVLFILGAAVIRTGVDLTPQLSLQGFSLSTFVPTVVIAFGTFVAFEGLTALAKETNNPRRTMPIVVHTLVACLVAAALVATVLTVPTLLHHTRELYAGESPLHVLADVGGVGWVGLPADILLSLSIGGALIAYVNDSSRVVATAGQDGYLPKVLGRIDPKHHTPALAARIMASIAFLMMAAFLLLTNQGMYGVTLNFTAFIVYSWAVAYVAIAVAGGVVAWRAHSIRGVVASAVVIAFLVAVTLYSVATASGVAALFTWIVFGAIDVLFGVTVLVRRRRITDVSSTHRHSEAFEPAGAEPTV